MRKPSNYNGRNRNKNLANIIVLFCCVLWFYADFQESFKPFSAFYLRSFNVTTSISDELKGSATMKAFITSLKGNVSILETTVE